MPKLTELKLGNFLDIVEQSAQKNSDQKESAKLMDEVSIMRENLAPNLNTPLKDIDVFGPRMQLATQEMSEKGAFQVIPGIIGKVRNEKASKENLNPEEIESIVTKFAHHSSIEIPHDRRLFQGDLDIPQNKDLVLAKLPKTIESLQNKAKSFGEKGGELSESLGALNINGEETSEELNQKVELYGDLWKGVVKLAEQGLSGQVDFTRSGKISASPEAEKQEGLDTKDVKIPKTYLSDKAVEDELEARKNKDNSTEYKAAQDTGANEKQSLETDTKPPSLLSRLFNSCVQFFKEAYQYFFSSEKSPEATADKSGSTAAPKESAASLDLSNAAEKETASVIKNLKGAINPESSTAETEGNTKQDYQVPNAPASEQTR
jgi:hypothetical protein